MLEGFVDARGIRDLPPVLAKEGAVAMPKKGKRNDMRKGGKR